MQLLSQVFSVKMLYRQLITTTLSIYKNFSLGLLCKALHNKPYKTPPDFHLGVFRIIAYSVLRLLRITLLSCGGAG